MPGPALAESSGRGRSPHSHLPQLQRHQPGTLFREIKCRHNSRLRARHLARAAGARVSAVSAHSDGSKAYDVVALGNLCVDVVVPMEKLPPVEEVKRPELLERLTQDAATGSTDSWEAGAQSNFMIAAARLGLRVASVANIGQDVYGDFLTRVLKEEGVRKLEPLAPEVFEEALKRTLLCFVLVGPSGAHQFCSRYDFGPWPLLPGVETLPPGVLKALQSTHALFLNGFIFDELPGAVVLAAVEAARAAGAATFFDPGPRAWTLQQGERKRVLDALLDACDVILMTQEEAEAVTGLADPEAAAIAILERPQSLTEWCLVKMGPQGALLRTRSPPRTLRQPAIQVPVADTVGCGDSFAAAVVLGYIQRHPLEPVLALSNAVGAATATSTGAGRNVASADTVRRLLAEQAQGSAPGLESDDFGVWVDRLVQDEVSARQRSATAGQQERQTPASPSAAAQALRLLDDSLAISP